MDPYYNWLVLIWPIALIVFVVWFFRAYVKEMPYAKKRKGRMKSAQTTTTSSTEDLYSRQTAS